MPSSTPDGERQPLLPNNEDQLSSSELSGRPGIRQRLSRAVASLKVFLSEDPIIVCTFCLQFCNYFSKHVIEVPIIKLFEQAICERYYAANDELLQTMAGSIDEQLCKIPAIQNELASLVGWKFTFDALPGI